MFFKHADEERQHGLMFLSYLRLRGDADKDVLGRGLDAAPLLPVLGKHSWADAEAALRDALHMEKTVTGEDRQGGRQSTEELRGLIVSLLRTCSNIILSCVQRRKHNYIAQNWASLREVMCETRHKE